MSPEFSESPSWWRALTLAERVALLRRSGSAVPAAAADRDRADRRLRKWKSQPPFDTGDFFARRLALEGVEEIELHRLLGEPAEALRDRQPATPWWLEELERAFRNDGPHADATAGSPKPAPGIEGFPAAFAPIIRVGRSRLRQGLRSLARETPRLPFDPAAVEDLFFDGLAKRLFTISIGTLVLELNVARVRGHLTGETPEERFRSFLAMLQQRDIVLAILEEYPVLARLLAEAAGRWADFCVEFLQRLSTNWEDLCSTFLPGRDPGLLAGVEMGAGDSHREGRSVVVAVFSSGFKVVYKPRSLAADVHFQELLAWINDRGGHPPFRILKIIDRRTHGWTEFVEARGCTGTDELRRFYRRQGGHLAVLYALEAVDFHAENLVASGEHPVLIDLEALFHPPAAAGGSGLGPEGESAPERTVLRVGLLPFLVGGDKDAPGIDLSGLGRRPGQVTPFGLPQWEDAGTDTMHLGIGPVILSAAKNRPSFQGEDVDPAAYSEDIASGFAQVYRLLLEHKAALLAAEGPLAAFKADEVRFIVRDTQSYAALLQTSYHPDALRDALDRDRVLDLLWIQAASQPSLARLIGAERKDLSRGDVLLFTARPDSRDLRSSSGEILSGYFEQPTMTTVRRRLEALSDADLALQLAHIRKSLSAPARNAGRAQSPEGGGGALPGRESER